jgi:GNAT superfamily N-acetyltransferase
MIEPVVRPAVDGDLPMFRDIEYASGQRFREYGLDHVADHEPASIEELSHYAKDGRAWAAVDPADQPIGYILVDLVDGLGHIEQVSVRPDWQGRGVGRALVHRAESWAVSRGIRALTLTTFGHIPWNGPLYEHLGFRILSPDQISPGLQAVRDAETEHGLDPHLRVVMRMDLHP